MAHKSPYRYRWKHVPTGRYFGAKYKMAKGIWKVWSNLRGMGKIFNGKPDPRLIIMYYHPDDSYNLKVASPLRISKPGEWIAEIYDKKKEKRSGLPPV